MSNSRLLSLFSVALLLSCAGSTLFAPSGGDNKKNKTISVDLSESANSQSTEEEDLYLKLDGTAANQRQTNFNGAFVFYLAALVTHRGTTWFTQEPEENSLCNFLGDVENAALTTTALQGARYYIENDTWKTLSKRISLFDKNGRSKDYHNSEAALETGLSVTGNVAVRQIRHTYRFKKLCESMGIDEWPEPVQKSLGEFGATAGGESLVYVAKAIFNYFLPQ